MKILVVDDHHLIREGLRPVLRQLAAGEPLEVLDAPTFAAALGEIARHPDVDLVLLDLRLPDVVGYEALSELQRRHADLPVVIMSGENDPPRVREALERGALGYIPKSSSPAVILNALRLVLSGGTYVPREAMNAAADPPVPAAGGPEALRALDLTPRQVEVLALLVGGKSNKQICRELDLAEGTVKAHIGAVFRALKVTSRVQAVIAAARLGIKA